MAHVLHNLVIKQSAREEQLATRLLAVSLYDDDKFQKMLKSKSVKSLMKKKIIRYTAIGHLDYED